MMRSRKGFTLIELLVVLGLLSVSTTLSVSVFMVMNDRWDEIRTVADFDERATNIFEDFRRDTETALSAQQASVSIEHENKLHKSPEADFFQIAFEDDSLTLPIFAQVGSKRNLTAAIVRYAIVRNNRSYQLRRQIAELDGEFEGGGILISDGVIGFDVQFPAANGYGWTQEWNRPGTPPLIRVNILMLDPDDFSKQATRSAVLRIRT